MKFLHVYLRHVSDVYHLSNPIPFNNSVHSTLGVNNNVHSTARRIHQGNMYTIHTDRPSVLSSHSSAFFCSLHIYSCLASSLDIRDAPHTFIHTCRQRHHGIYSLFIAHLILCACLRRDRGAHRASKRMQFICPDFFTSAE